MVSLRLSRNALTGTLPAEWDSNVLIELDLSQNQLSGADRT